MIRRALSLHSTRQALARLTLVLSLLLVWASGATKPSEARGLSQPGAAAVLAQGSDWPAIQTKTAASPRATEDRGLTGPEPFLTARQALPAPVSHAAGQAQAAAAPAPRGAHHRPQAPRAPPAA